MKKDKIVIVVWENGNWCTQLPEVKYSGECCFLSVPKELTTTEIDFEVQALLQKRKENKMKIEQGKQYKTRCGELVRILCTDLRDKRYPIVGAVLQPSGTELLLRYTRQGHYAYQSVCPMDLLREYTTVRVFPMESLKGMVVRIDGEERAVLSYGGSTLWTSHVEDYSKKSKRVSPVIIEASDLLKMEVVRWIK